MSRISHLPAAAATAFAIALVACAPAASISTAPRPVSGGATSVTWTRTSAEHRAIFEQVYGGATRALDSLARGRPGGSWGVILDADETILDNSEYQRRRVAVDSGFTAASWSAWVSERAAPALPGAGEFLRHVRALGGMVVIVTNRTQGECPDTRANLEMVGLPTDLVLCMADGPGASDKNARFAAVQDGSAASNVPALEVLLWIGDNIRDFPSLDQSMRDAPPASFAPFGRRYFLLPNPMYGSWER